MKLLSICLFAVDCIGLFAKLHLVRASVVVDCFASFLLKLCFSPKKTTYLLGNNDSRVKHRAGIEYDSEGWFLEVCTKAYGVVRIGIVHNYKYLGLIAQQSAFNLDVTRHATAAKCALGELNGGRSSR